MKLKLRLAASKSVVVWIEEEEVENMQDWGEAASLPFARTGCLSVVVVRGR